VRLSVVEIYCERIRDLLDPSRDNLQVKQDAGGAIFIEGGPLLLVMLSGLWFGCWDHPLGDPQADGM
jgi:hypothetical protein